MKLLGLIGGTSWVSTVEYYTLINQGINEKLGGLNFSECMIYSFNFAEIKKNIDAGDWDTIFQMFLKACNALTASGAEAIVLCAATAHNIADRLQKETHLPILHLATATALEIQKQGLKKVALLGTRFTMEFDFFKTKLSDHGIETLIPNARDRAYIHDSIFDELGQGIFKAETKARYLSIIRNLINEGAEGIILGCTEIPLLLKPEDIPVPSFDTVQLHTKAAIDFSLS
ncbi:aspartate racemase [Pedobacter sp. KBW06]|uniref:aspartate/glutamate racemase family protein n=1 Tax=Pedobacter sp. KBW06 TaxID=2153359 RepID=UPI000F5A2F5C|nr:aspartate/glutamate racemase family protein [Pedobacter sp. KBW06]RQO75785.1 aspartate racemase [Pedobacter sp. KBW06]